MNHSIEIVKLPGNPASLDTSEGNYIMSQGGKERKRGVRLRVHYPDRAGTDTAKNEHTVVLLPNLYEPARGHDVPRLHQGYSADVKMVTYRF